MIPIKKGITGTDIPNIAVETSDSTIPRKPILVEGGPAPEPITVTALSVTENGSYNAGENAAYNPVTVNVPSQMPSEYLESEFDTEHLNSSIGFLDSIKNVKLPTNRYSKFSNGYLTANGGELTMSFANSGDVKKVIYEMGAFDRSLEPQQQYLGLFCFAYGTQGLVLYYDNDNDRWLVRDAGGSTEYIPGSDLPKYALENATIEVIYGAKYINGELFRGIKTGGAITADYTQNVTMYIHAANDAEYVIEYSSQLSADRPDYMFTARIGSGGSAWLGALFKNVKIYDVLNVYNKFYEADNRKIKNKIEPLTIISIKNNNEREVK